eukprot:750159-Amphidinium_carterae.1
MCAIMISLILRVVMISLILRVDFRSGVDLCETDMHLYEEVQRKARRNAVRMISVSGFKALIIMAIITCADPKEKQPKLA